MSTKIINPYEDLTNRLDRIENLLLTHNSSKPEIQETLSLSQAAKICQISISKMYDLSRRKFIPSSRIGNRYIFIKNDLLMWLRNQSN